MMFPGRYGSSPIASISLTLKYTVFVNKLILSLHIQFGYVHQLCLIASDMLGAPDSLLPSWQCPPSHWWSQLGMKREKKPSL
uniref:Uncharacterized protein n=1 Tax=Chelonoidis abingdonii TaxID=106734 RepID=A0A8C0G6F1_CHEAB